MFPPVLLYRCGALSLALGILLATSACRMEKTIARLADSCVDQTKVRPDAACAEIYQPVCGCDGRTYPNACIADNAGVTRHVFGPCETQPGETGKPPRNRQ